MRDYFTRCTLDGFFTMQLAALAFVTVLFTSVIGKNASADSFDFTVSTDNGVVTTSSFEGSVVYIDFWASWCVPCRKSFPWMNAMQIKYGHTGFKVLAINLDKDKDLAEDFLQRFPVQFDVGFDPDGAIAEKFNVIGMPMAFIMNRDGELIHKHVGFKASKTNDYEQSIVQVLEVSQ